MIRIWRSLSWLCLLCVIGLSSGTACSRAKTLEPPGPDALTVSAELSTNSVHVGDVFTLRLRLQHPARGDIRLPSLSNETNIVIRKERRTPRALGQGCVQTEILLDVTSFELGRHSFPTNDIVCALPDGSELRTPLPLLSFEVVSILNATNRVLQPSHSVLNWPGRVPRWLWVLPGIAFLAGMIGWLVGRFLSKPRTILQMPPPEPPHVVALRALRALKTKGWIESENAEPFYVELSGIVRRYIENRFGIRAPELTTEEFIREAAQSKELTGPQQDLVRSFLEQADLVKFARFHPGRPEMTAAFESAERLVLDTIPAAAPTEEGCSP